MAAESRVSVCRRAPRPARWRLHLFTDPLVYPPWVPAPSRQRPEGLLWGVEGGLPSQNRLHSIWGGQAGVLPLLGNNVWEGLPVLKKSRRGQSWKLPDHLTV